MTPTALARLRALAAEAAHTHHLIARSDGAAAVDQRHDRAWFDECSHPDCVLVRTDLASAASRPTPEPPTYRPDGDSPNEPPRCKSEPPVNWDGLHEAIRWVRIGWWDANGACEAFARRPALRVPSAPDGK